MSDRVYDALIWGTFALALALIMAVGTVISLVWAGVIQ